jgi:single-stranded DNA-binding protein
MEGTIIKKPKFETLPNKRQICTFRLLNTLHERDDNKKMIITKNSFTIVLYDKSIEKIKNINDTKGKNIRVVGRLREEVLNGSTEPSVVIEAEHIEVRVES